jgi:hypothetical protein
MRRSRQVREQAASATTSTSSVRLSIVSRDDLRLPRSAGTSSVARQHGSRAAKDVRPQKIDGPDTSAPNSIHADAREWHPS